MRTPYLRKYGIISSFTIWIVDGAYIRKNTDINFTNFGQHYRHPFIPKNEFWIDQEHKPGDAPFYIDHLLLENKLMASGKTYRYALARADRKELSERHKASGKGFVRRTKEIPRKIYIRHLKQYSGNANVYLVDGELVRDLYHVEYTEGGHDRVYSFIPSNEVWIDDDLSPNERKFVILHELTERALMSDGMMYSPAHKLANVAELRARKNPSTSATAVKKAIADQ